MRIDTALARPPIHQATTMNINITLLSAACVALWAASAGHAVAQSNVQAYGLIDLSVGRTQAPGGKAIKTLDSGKMTTSHLGFKGTEDLGSGLKASFVLEHFLRADTGLAGRFDGDAFWARNAYVGLSGDLGTVSLGRHTTALFVQTLLFNPFGDSFGYAPSVRHFFTSGTTTGDSGWSDSVRYASPRFGGLSATLMLAAGEGNGGRNSAADLRYASGALAAGLSWQEVKKGATVQDTTTWQLAGSYDLKVAKLFAQFGSVDNNSTGRNYDISELGVSVPVGAGKLLAQWGQIKPDVGAKRTTLSLGYDHNLSKRTDVYAVLMSDKLSGLSTGNNLSLGMRHRF